MHSYKAFIRLTLMKRDWCYLNLAGRNRSNEPMLTIARMHAYDGLKTFEKFMVLNEVILHERVNLLQHCQPAKTFFRLAFVPYRICLYFNDARSEKVLIGIELIRDVSF